MTEEKKYPTAVVIELSIAGLSIIRSLGKRGICVIGIDSKRSNFGALSKYCSFLYCRNVNDSNLIETLLNLGERMDQKAVLFCASDLSVSVVSNRREELQKYFNFILPSNEVIEILQNKRLFYKFALEHGFLVPNTFFTCNLEEVKIVGSKISYPCVIKPELRDDYWYTHVPLKDKVLLAYSKDEFLNIFKKYSISERPLIIQEWIHGNDDDVYFCLTYINSNFQPLAIFTGRKIRQYPILTGVTSAAESLWEPFICKESLRLLKISGCIGLCSVEFKYCRKDKVFKVTEPTVGRPDLQEAISIASGVDLPYIAYLDAIGAAPKALSELKQHIKWICEPMEIYSVRQYLKEKRCNIKQLISTYSGKRSYALMDLQDPLPFLSFFANKLKIKISNFMNIRFKKNI